MAFDYALLAPYGRHGIQRQQPLAPFTTFRIGGPAAALLVVQLLRDLVAALNLLHANEAPFLLLGGGSNVLIPDAGIDTLVILNQCRQIQWPPTTGALPTAAHSVRVESGAALAGLARGAIKRGLSGLTWAVSVPGTVGGAVVGNAGAHGGCIADNLHSVALWEAGRVEVHPAADLELAYRRSRLKATTSRPSARTGPVVLSATFMLELDASSGEAARAAQFIAHRRRTQPSAHSAGSIFKNPPGDFAGRLIEAAGLKGAHVGDACVSELHANFIINQGHATAADVLQLITHIQTEVAARFGVQLEPEILMFAPGHPHPEPSIPRTESS